ncbi:MAG: hypothetical protein IPJ65_39800 [Archangiaceae bacterium]|nr:hypothetical protein [Archangiaceae bacterium]
MNIFEVSSAEMLNINVDAVRSQVDSSGFAIVRGAVREDSVAAFRKRVVDLFSRGRDERVSGDYKRGSADFQRLDLGEYPASTRFARYFMLFPWNNDATFSAISDMQMKVLNLLSRKPLEVGQLGADYNEKRFRMSFVIQYPAGGGFMSKHREYTGQEEGDKAYVVYLALTTRGVDYESGGAYVYVDDRKVDIEGVVRAGDIVIYRGDYYHGVDGVDRDRAVDLATVCGRMMLTTVVKYFK